MAISSILAKLISKFELPNDENNKIEIKQDNTLVGNITKTNQSLTIDRMIFYVYNCEYFKDISGDEILIDDTLNGYNGYREIDDYKKKFKFKLFYNNEKGLSFFSGAPSPIIKTFLKSLSKTENVIIEFRDIPLNFNDIYKKFVTTRGIRFNSNDRGVNKKAFNGSNIIENPEATDAISENSATQIIGELDVGNKTYVILITKSGSIVSYTKLFNYEKKENPMLEFAIDVLHALNILNNI